MIGRLIVRVGAAVLGLIAIAATPAAAAEWPSVAGWDVHEIGRDRCVVGRAFTGTGTTFGIIMGLDGEVRLFATAAGWPALNGRPSAGTVLLDGAPALDGGAVGMEQQGNRGFVVAASPDFLVRFARARQLGLHAGPGTDQSALPLTGAGLGIAQGRRCLDSLRYEARSAASTITPTPSPASAQRVAALSNRLDSAIPVASTTAATVARIAQGPVPRGSKSGWMANVDYPSEALRAGEQGAVTVKLAVDTSGGVSSCDVVKSSGSASLDAETCRAVRRRARYTPATDERGQAVASVDQHTVRWALPE